MVCCLLMGLLLGLAKIISSIIAGLFTGRHTIISLFQESMVKKFKLYFRPLDIVNVLFSNKKNFQIKMNIISLCLNKKKFCTSQPQVPAPVVVMDFSRLN